MIGPDVPGTPPNPRFIVKKGDQRPARLDGTCFYCHPPIGTEHNLGCVLRTREVVMEVKILVVRSIPEDWDSDNIQFYFNDGTRCADNTIDELKTVLKSWKGARCFCDTMQENYVREATPVDLEKIGHVK